MIKRQRLQEEQSNQFSYKIMISKTARGRIVKNQPLPSKKEALFKQYELSKYRHSARNILLQDLSNRQIRKNSDLIRKPAFEALRPELSIDQKLQLKRKERQQLQSVSIKQVKWSIQQTLSKAKRLKEDYELNFSRDRHESRREDNLTGVQAKSPCQQLRELMEKSEVKEFSLSGRESEQKWSEKREQVRSSLSQISNLHLQDRLQQRLNNKMIKLSETINLSRVKEQTVEDSLALRPELSRQTPKPLDPSVKQKLSLMIKDQLQIRMSAYKSQSKLRFQQEKAKPPTKVEVQIQTRKSLQTQTNQRAYNKLVGCLKEAVKENLNLRKLRSSVPDSAIKSVLYELQREHLLNAHYAQSLDGEIDPTVAKSSQSIAQLSLKLAKATKRFYQFYQLNLKNKFRRQQICKLFEVCDRYNQKKVSLADWTREMSLLTREVLRPGDTMRLFKLLGQENLITFNSLLARLVKA